MLKAGVPLSGGRAGGTVSRRQDRGDRRANQAPHPGSSDPRVRVVLGDPPGGKASSMHMIWLKTELLHPVNKGGRIRSYYMLRELAREHEITYVTTDDGPADSEAVRRSGEYAHHLVRRPHRLPRRGSARFLIGASANLLSPLPFSVGRYRSPELQRALAGRLARGGIDLIVCDFLTSAVNLPQSAWLTPTVLFQHNVEYTIWERHAAVARSPIARAYLANQCRKMRRYEARTCQRFDRVVTVSDVDRVVHETELGLPDVVAVPTGVDVDYFGPGADDARRPAELVFTGSMDWLPNADAIAFFAEYVLPLVRARVPDVKLTVVGRSPTAAIRRLADSDPAIRVTGEVPDVRPYLARASVFIVPIRIGGGTRLKIFEAMAAGLPVVSTTIGAEGLPLSPGTDILLADDPRSLADAVVALLSEPGRARALGRAGASLVRERFSWPAVIRTFATACEEVVERRRWKTAR